MTECTALKEILKSAEMSLHYQHIDNAERREQEAYCSEHMSVKIIITGWQWVFVSALHPDCSNDDKVFAYATLLECSDCPSTVLLI